MENKSTVALEYNTQNCDDIGILFYIRYTCPHCGEINSDQGLTTYDDLSGYYKLPAYCKKCNNTCTVHNPNK